MTRRRVSDKSLGQERQQKFCMSSFLLWTSLWTFSNPSFQSLLQKADGRDTLTQTWRTTKENQVLWENHGFIQSSSRLESICTTQVFLLQVTSHASTPNRDSKTSNRVLHLLVNQRWTWGTCWSCQHLSSLFHPHVGPKKTMVPSVTFPLNTKERFWCRNNYLMELLYPVYHHHRHYRPQVVHYHTQRLLLKQIVSPHGVDVTGKEVVWLYWRTRLAEKTVCDVFIWRSRLPM